MSKAEYDQMLATAEKSDIGHHHGGDGHDESHTGTITGAGGGRDDGHDHSDSQGGAHAHG